MQAATLAALAMAGVVDVYEHRNKTNEVSGQSNSCAHMLCWEKCQRVKKENCHHSLLAEAGLVYINRCTSWQLQ